MKALKCLFMMLLVAVCVALPLTGTSAASSSKALAIRISKYKSLNESFLLEVFNFNFPYDETLSGLNKLESKFKHDLSLSFTDTKGNFMLESENINWEKEEYIIHPGTFSIQLKNSKREIKVSGKLDNISNNHYDLDLNYSCSRPNPKATDFVRRNYNVKYGDVQDVYSFSRNFSSELGQIEICGGSSQYDSRFDDSAE